MTQHKSNTPAGAPPAGHNDKKRTLWADHLRILADRGIPESVAREHGLYSVDLREEKRLRERYPGYQSPLPHLPCHETTGLAMPYPSVPKDGIERVRVRADETEVTIDGPMDGSHHGERTVSIPRYICQAKPATVIPYITGAVREIAGDTTKVIYIVEAPLKALALVAHGMPAIGLGGVLAGAHDASMLHEYGELSAHPILKEIDWRGRVVVIVFDASVTTNPMVALGAAFTALALEREGAQVWITRIPHFHVQESDPQRGVVYRAEDQGPDDHLVRLGVGSLQWHIMQSVPASPLRRVARFVEQHSGVELTNAITGMLRELHVLALLSRDPTLIDRLAAATKKHGVGVQTIKRAVAEFNGTLKSKVTKLNKGSDKRPVVYVSTNEAEVNDAIIEALRGDADLFQRGKKLVGIVREPDPPPGTLKEDPAAGEFRRAPGALTINVLPTPSLRERITRHVSLLQRGDEEDTPVHPEPWMASAIGARGSWPGIPQLTGIVQAPTLRPDGTILQTAGYDAATGLLYVPNEVFPAIPESPTKEEAEAAYQVLLEPLAEYEFEKPMHQVAAVAAMMTPLLRSAILGPVPVTVVDAPKRGIGKTMLVDIMSIIATGHNSAKFAYSDDNNEVKKALLAVVIGGDTFLLVDNAPGRFGGHVWDGFLTAYPTWKDRVLGISGTYEGPNIVCVFVTGNNVVPQGDTARRSNHVRLTTKHERPDMRDDFTVKDLRAHVRANRPRYVAAALTLVRAYIAANRPQVTTRTWGTFEHWHDLIAKPLIWLGLDDPSETRTAFEDQAETPTSQTASLLGAWHRAYEEEPQLAGNVLRAIQAERTSPTKEGTNMLLLGDAIVAACGGREAGLPSAKALGKRLAALKGCVEDGLRIVDAGADSGTTLWKVERVGVSMATASDESSGMGEPMTEEELDDLSKAAAVSGAAANGTTNGYVSVDEDLLDLV